MIEGQAAETVVAAELDNDDFRMKAKDRGKAGDRVLGSGSTNALIQDLVVVALGVELALKGVGEGLARGEAVAGGDAVAEADKDVLGDLLGGGEKARSTKEIAIRRVRRTSTTVV